MKSFLVLVVLMYGVVAKESIGLYYHSSVGVDLATKIRAAEEAFDYNSASRITGGSAAAVGSHPHFGGLIVALPSNQTSVCGSSLLTNNRSLTAAHCWWDGQIQATLFTVVVGTNFLFSGGYRVNTTNVQMHANFSTTYLNNDIAIITHTSIPYNNVIQPINLPVGMTNDLFVGVYAWAAGFGATGDGHPITYGQYLSEVQLQVITNAACATTYGTGVVTANALCTNGTLLRSTCAGDYGSPLWIWSGANRVLIGVTSFSHIAGCQRGYPSGFTRITSYLAWIQARL